MRPLRDGTSTHIPALSRIRSVVLNAIISQPLTLMRNPWCRPCVPSGEPSTRQGQNTLSREWQADEPPCCQMCSLSVCLWL